MLDSKCGAFCPSLSPTFDSSSATSTPVVGSTVVAWAARLALSHEDHASQTHMYSSYGFDEDKDECYGGHHMRSFHPVSAERDAPAAPSSSRLPSERVYTMSSSSVKPILSPFSIAVLASYPLPTPLHEVSPGVLSDGSKTTAYPPVQQVLREPEYGRKHPLLTDRMVEALVIIAVMRQPHHPLHLCYWDGLQKDKMDLADRYNKTLKIWDGLEADPPTIRAPWLFHGREEALFTMRQMQARERVSDEFKWDDESGKTARSAAAAGKRKAAAQAAAASFPEAEQRTKRRKVLGEQEPRTNGRSRLPVAVEQPLSDEDEDGSPLPAPRRSARNRSSQDDESPSATPRARPVDLPVSGKNKRDSRPRSPSASSLAPSASTSGSSTAVSERDVSDLRSSDGSTVADDLLLVVEEEPKRSSRARKPARKADVELESALSMRKAPASRSRGKAPAPTRTSSTGRAKSKVQRVTRIAST